MGMIKDIEDMLDDLLFGAVGLEYVHIKRDADVYDIEQLYYLLAYPNETEQAKGLLDLFKEKAAKGESAFLAFLRSIFDFDDAGELLEAMEPGPVKDLIGGALSVVQRLTPGTLVTKDHVNEAVVYVVERGYTCMSPFNGNRTEIYAPAWSGPCPPNYDKLKRNALISVNGGWWQVAGELRRRILPGSEDEHFTLSVNKVSNLHMDMPHAIMVDPVIDDVIAPRDLYKCELILRVMEEKKGGGDE